MAGKAWRRQRLDRMLVEHFLRQGFYDTAIQLAKAEGLEELTNIEVFLTAKEVEVREAITIQAPNEVRVALGVHVMIIMLLIKKAPNHPLEPRVKYCTTPLTRFLM